MSKLNKFILVTTLNILFFVYTSTVNHVGAWSSYSIGGTDYYNYDNGYGRGYNINDTYYYNDSYGWSGRNYSVGGTNYYDYDNYDYGTSLHGNSYDVGGTTYYNFNNDYGNTYNGSSYSIGGTDYYDFGDYSYRCYWIGETYYCN